MNGKWFLLRLRFVSVARWFIDVTPHCHLFTNDCDLETEIVSFASQNMPCASPSGSRGASRDSWDHKKIEFKVQA